ncbi:MAG: hypothetical protein HC933_16450, partial [Pleurocapsa sp. SU_196_0]|nr:hypothetical protein [Pleurocapsa sp. SU_196_0]
MASLSIFNWKRSMLAMLGRMMSAPRNAAGVVLPKFVAQNGSPYFSAILPIQPSLSLAFGSAGVPDGHALEVRTVRVGITHALNQPNFPSV